MNTKTRYTITTTPGAELPVHLTVEADHFTVEAGTLQFHDAPDFPPSHALAPGTWQMVREYRAERDGEDLPTLETFDTPPPPPPVSPGTTLQPETELDHKGAVALRRSHLEAERLTALALKGVSGSALIIHAMEAKSALRDLGQGVVGLIAQAKAADQSTAYLDEVMLAIRGKWNEVVKIAGDVAF
jgi:hypothetical protein